MQLTSMSNICQYLDALMPVQSICPHHLCQVKISFSCISFVLLAKKSLGFFQDNCAFQIADPLFSSFTKHSPTFGSQRSFAKDSM